MPTPHAPKPVALIIGTAETAAALADQFGVVPGVPAVAGCVLCGPSAGTRVGSSFLGTALPVLGGLADLARVVSEHGATLAIISLPSVMGAEALRARAAVRALGLAERIVPPIAEMLANAPPVRGVFGLGPRLDMSELIGRTAYGIDTRSVAGILAGKRVLITGAGGSIGSELARIVATFHPETLVLMERAENALFEVDRRLARSHPGVARRAVLHDVVDAEATLRHLVGLRPHVVFHAAAHKHVPLMEDHPAHAVTNNVFGTKSIADAAQTVGAERLVMISSDKAVNPRSVMGATKRLAEVYVQSLHAREHGRGGTRLSMVRFGNVLGSACSVLPIWSSQLGEGGPITVTDERMTRYFMTIHEAAALVIQSAAVEPEAGEASAGVFVLDMGEPVRILELAGRFVRAHGFETRIVRRGVSPGSEDPGAITIEITGARPGEKLHEELAYDAEQLRPTRYPGINAWIAQGREEENSAASMIADLSAVRSVSDRGAVLSVLRRYVPTLPGDDARVQEPKATHTGTGQYGRPVAA